MHIGGKKLPTGLLIYHFYICKKRKFKLIACINAETYYKFCFLGTLAKGPTPKSDLYTQEDNPLTWKRSTHTREEIRRRPHMQEAAAYPEFEPWVGK